MISTVESDVAVIGAGLSGLVAASTLLDAGRNVFVIEKEDDVGGRLATRRIGDATLDHGAQFFTVRGDDFRRTVDAAIAEGIVEVWCHGFEIDDGYPRYFCPNGMSALAMWLAESVRSRGGVIATGKHVRAIEAHDETWRILVEGEPANLATDLIVTSPVPQTMSLIDEGGVLLDPELDETLRAITYKPTLALLVTLEQPSAVAAPGGIQRTENDLFTFITDNHHKGLSAIPALTFHVNGRVSGARWNDNPAVVLAELLAKAKPWIGDASIIEIELQKWKFAGPYAPHPERYVVARTSPGSLVLAGDAFGGPKVEGAFNSGQAAAEVLIG
ncbi:MAG: renalase [Verrucomicrobiales bacterium]|jgi:renalase